MVARGLADELRDACMEIALQLGGWNKHGKLRNGKFKQSELPRAASS